MFRTILCMFMLIIARTCVIAKAEIGMCQPASVFPSHYFCAGYTTASVCVPLPSTTWSSFDLRYSDAQIQSLFITSLQSRLLDEYEYANASLVISNNPSCFQALKSFLCQWNFPRCNAEDVSLPMCSSVCTNYFTACGSSTDVCEIIYANTGMGIDTNC